MILLGRELMRSLDQLSNSPDEALLERTTQFFQEDNQRAWQMLASELRFYESRDTPTTEESELFKKYISWYTNHAGALVKHDLRFSQVLALTTHYDQILFAANQLRTNDEAHNRELIHYIKLSRAALLFTYQNENLVAKRQRLVEMMAENDPQKLHELRAGLIVTANAFANASNGSLTLVPEEYRWLVGLGELVMDFNLKNSLNLYLDHYTVALNSLLDKKDSIASLKVKDPDHPRAWAHTILIVPLTHIASLTGHAPHASRRALALLKKFAKLTPSNYLKRRTNHAIGYLPSTTSGKCRMTLFKLKQAMTRLGDRK